jgi:methanogenic corrinoid protein MtbC1
MTTIGELSTDPKYTIKTVTIQTGIRSVTIRAWEKRYGLLTPQRSENRYRLYSEQDVALLRWVKMMADNGMMISRVAAEVNRFRETGEWPETPPPMVQVRPAMQEIPPSRLADQLYQALVVHHEETEANEILQQAHSLYDLTTVCIDIITACLIKVGESWHRGDLRITEEHYASRYLQGKLVSLFQAFPNRRGAASIIMGCAPNELHEIGILMLAVMLRHEGYQVEYLGADVPLEDLVDYARQEKPDMICLSATSKENALTFAKLESQLKTIRPAPVFGYGGMAFNVDPSLIERIPGHYLGDTIVEARQKIKELLG